jgi:hypothetical protein
MLKAKKEHYSVGSIWQLNIVLTCFNRPFFSLNQMTKIKKVSDIKVFFMKLKKVFTYIIQVT